MSTCRSCDDGWSLNEEGLCAPEHRDRCKTTEFYENGHCKQCHASCKTCAGPGENNCISCQKPLLLQAKRCVYQCDDGYYSMAQPSGPVCVPCLHTCKTCVSRLNCTACQDGLQLQSGECRSSCAQGWVPFLSYSCIILVATLTWNWVSANKWVDREFEFYVSTLKLKS